MKNKLRVACRALFVGPPGPRLDAAWMRWLATICAIATAVSFAFVRKVPWLLPISATALGIALSAYFAVILLFRLQCSLLELLAITSIFGLVDGLVISTPGMMRIGLYLNPFIAAWVLWGATSGLVDALLLGENRPGMRLIFIAARLLGSLWFGLFAVGGMILLFAQHPRIGMAAYEYLEWPFFAASFASLLIWGWIYFTVRKRANALLKEYGPQPSRLPVAPPDSQGTIHVDRA